MSAPAASVAAVDDVLRLSAVDARRVAVRAQLLTAPRPDDVLEVLRHLTVLQLDPTRAVAASPDLVLWSRLGSAYDPRELTRLVDTQRVVELGGLLRPAEDVALFRAAMQAWPGGLDPRPWREGLARWLRDNERCRLDILELLRADGPLPSRALPDTCVRPWRSTGWTNDKNVTRMLDLMVASGQVAVAGRDGRERLFDLAERVYVPQVVPLEEADRRVRERRLAAMGIARGRAAQNPVEPVDVGEVGVLAVVEGVRGTWRVLPELLDASFVPRTALLSPFDRLLQDRRRMTELFAFDYVLEMFKPAAARRWGYYALPVLHGDRLVGKVDATADVRAGVLRVDAVHRDGAWDAATVAAVDDELDDLACWLELDLLRADR